MAATLGAGAQDDEVFQALAPHNAVTVGGTYKVSKSILFPPHLSVRLVLTYLQTVGIVGWSTGGVRNFHL
jgi:hypothetical protein